jgi:hypothetical protein
MNTRLMALIIGGALILAAGPLWAADSDGDGIPDEVEQSLGTNPRVAEKFSLLHRDGVAGQDDKSLSRDFADAPDVVDISLAPVAQFRWLWKVTFTKDYVGAGNTFILYLDVDNDLTTGRQDNPANRGTDLMYTQQNGRFTRTEHTPGLCSDAVRMAVVGPVLYICTDLALGQGASVGKVRFKVLSHVSPPRNNDSDTMDWVLADLPPASNAPRPRIGAPPPLAPLAKLTTARPDKDRDGIPDEIEMILGMNPDFPEPVHEVHDDGIIGQGDKTVSKDHKTAPDLAKIYFGNVAGNRYVWRLDFAADFDPSGTVLILYLDADNDLTTGRQDGARGCDVMLTCVNGVFDPSIRNSEVTTRDKRLRGVIDGRSVYFSMDLLLKQSPEGASEYRGWVLCHRREPTTDADSTAIFTVYGPGESERAKMKVGMASELRSQGMVVESPWIGWREDLQALQAVSLDLTAGRREGMRVFDRALVPEKPKASVVLTSPVAGKRHLGVVVQDSAAGEEILEVRHQGKVIGRLNCLQNDGLFHLFTTLKPLDLKRGDRLELIAAAPAQDFQISEVLLLPQPARPRDLALTYLTTYCPPQEGDTVTVDVCFLSNLPCPSRVRFGQNGKLDREAGANLDTYNHRVRLEGLQRGATYTVQAYVPANYGDAKTAPLTFVADQKRLARCGVARRQVPLQVRDSAAEGRPGWPVSGGVPLAAGELSSARHCRLLDASGQVVPAQFKELGWWPEGSVKWLLVSLVQGPGKPEYVLEYGSAVTAPPAPADSLRVETRPEGVWVTNGDWQVRVSRERFGAPGEIVRDTNRDGRFDEAPLAAAAPALLVDGQGKQYTTAGAPLEQLVVEEAGPVRVVLKAEGRLTGPEGKLFGFRCRMEFYRGFAGVPMMFALLNDVGPNVMPSTMTPVRSLTLPLTVAGAQAPRRRWVQEDDNSLRVEADGQTSTSEARGTGIATLGEGAGRVAVCVKDFWQMYPKGFTLQGNTLTTELFPQLPPDRYAQFTDLKLLTRNYYWFRDGNYLMPSGTMPDSELLVYLGPEAPEAVARRWQEPALLTATPEQFCSTKVFGELEPQQPGIMTSWQQFVEKGFAGLEQTRQRMKEYSWINYGDWWGERMVNWGNQEYDLQWGLLVHYARSGDRQFFDRALQAARHTAAIDTISFSPQPNYLGIQKVHCLGHVGGFGMTRVPGVEYWFEGAGYNTGHMWSQGQYAAYCLTGDPRYGDSAELLAQWLAGQYTRSLDTYIHRNYGWSTIAVLAGYQVTGNPYYLNAARLFTDYVAAKQDPGTGVLAHPIGECTHQPTHMGGKVFMSGAVMTGLRMRHEIDRDESSRQAAVRNCDWMYHRMWHPWDNSFQYAQCTQFDNSSTHAGTYEGVEGLAWAYEVSRDERIKEMLLRSLGDVVLQRGPSSHGKEYAMQIRMVPYALALLQRWGLKELSPPPPPAPRLGLDTEVYLLPGRPVKPGVMVINRGTQPVAAWAEVSGLPAGLKATPARVEWQAAPGGHPGPLTLQGTAPAGATFTLKAGAGGTVTEGKVTLRMPEKLKLGTQIGYVGGSQDPFGQALQMLKRTYPAVADLQPATLAGYRALILGGEAHTKGYGGLPVNAHRLLDFIYSGGRVLVSQLQDDGYQARFLPYPLAPVNPSSTGGEIVQPQHPIFSQPHKIDSLQGVMSYDTLVSADPAWEVLARDAKGGPAVVEAKFGQGRVLVVQPSVDRYVSGELGGDDKGLEATCAKFVENLLAWLESR